MATKRNAKVIIENDSGNVGIGTTTPYTKLTVEDSSLPAITISSSAATAVACNLYQGGYASHTGLTFLNNGSGSYTSYGLISDGTTLKFKTAAYSINTGSNLVTGWTDRIIINSSGYLGVGLDASYPLDVSGSVSGSFASRITNSTGTDPYGLALVFSGASPNNTSQYFLSCTDSTTARFYLYSNGNVVNSNNSYGAISDVRLKENIIDTTPKLDDLLRVKIKNYNLIGDEKKQIGVVAQELEEVFPSMIDESTIKKKNEVGEEIEEVYKSVKYSVFIPILIKSIQEQQEIINSLKARIETLENA